ncbi:MAG: phage terminase large subunit [Chitinophagales bacterium]|nr:phage terminase large subunit [Chitinophagales bacterium]MBP9845848.1 phage terminase large subunit [Saprospiraceae bacterium]
MTLKPLEASLFKKIPEELKLPMRQSGVVVVEDALIKLWTLPKDTNTVVLIGGRGGMKTWCASDFIAHQAAVNNKRCVVLRDEHSRIKDTILNEILDRYDAIPFKTDTEKLTTGIKDAKAGKDLVFTMGFRASDNKKKANMKGISDIDIAVVEEAEDITDPDKFNTFVDGLRKEGCLVIVILNTPDIGHFILKSYFDTIDAPIPEGVPEQFKKDFEGYYKIVPKKNIPGFVAIQTGYTDNPHLPKHVVDRYNSYKDPSSNLYNPHYYMTAIMGYASTGRKGQVLKKVQAIPLADYMALPFKEYYGQDFGTAAPAGFVGVKFDKNNCYCREINYLPMNVLSIAKLYCQLGLTASDKIVADCADEKAIKKLKSGFRIEELSEEDYKNYPGIVNGFHVVPCVKGSDSVRNGIDKMDTLNLFAVSESKNLWSEIYNRVYDQDKNGNYTNDPKPGNDHLQDPWMYVIQDRFSKKGQSSIAV